MLRERATPTHPPLSSSRTVAALWAVVLAGVVGAVRVLSWYWPGSFFDGVTSNVWTALAWDAAHGEFYRPLLSPSGYGGTRYMPLFFLLHAAFIKLGFDAVYSGIALMQLSVLAAGLALLLALRSADVPWRLCVPLAGTVWCTVVYQKYCTDVRADYLAAAFALAAAALAFRIRGRRRPLWLADAAACLVVLAGMTKVTALVFAVPIAVWLLVEGRRDLAVRFAAGVLVLFATACAVVQFASAGRFFESVLATVTGGLTTPDVWRALPNVVQEVASDPFVAGPVALACWAFVAAVRRRSLSFAHAYFAVAVPVTAALFASPGIVANQLVDLHLAATLVVGLSLMRGDVSQRAVTWVYAALAAVAVVVSIPLSRVPSVMATLQAQGPRQRATVRSLQDEFLPVGARYLSTDPIIPVLRNERAVLIDAFNLERFLNAGTPAGLDIAMRIGARGFDTIVLRDSPAFPRDAREGDVGFDAARVRYWADQRGELARLFHSEYEVRAVRKPFVILRPRVD